VGALPRPDLPPGAGRELSNALHDLHHRAGWPSLRRLARETGVSHTTVSKVMSAPALPAWGTLELLVEAMGGDTGRFHDLWLVASTPPGVTSAAGTPSRIAGRSSELAGVRRHLETGTGLLLVSGEAGIGKTTLIQAATDAAPTFVASGHCLPMASEVPLMPVVDVLTAIHDVDDGRWFKDALLDAPPFVTQSLARLIPELDDGEVPPAGADDFARQHLLSSVAKVLARLAGLRPLTLLFEDLHWADPATLEMLEHLLGRSVPVAMVGAWRTEDDTTPRSSRDWFTRVQHLRNGTVLELGPLTHEETAEQLRLLAAPRREVTGFTDPRSHEDGSSTRTPTYNSMVDQIYGRSRGLPLFTEQLALQPDGPLPRLLDDVLGRRVAGLPAGERRVATVLAVADRGLAPEVLSCATTLPPGALTACLRSLTQHRLLADASQAVALRHPLLAEALRCRLVPGEAAEIHRRLAGALASTGDPGEVAAHWQGAGDTELELVWRIKAARAAHDRLAAREEVRQWQRVLELWRGDDLEQRHGLRRIDAALAQLDALEASSHTDRAWTLLLPMLERADSLPDLTAADIFCRASTYADLVQGTLAALEYAERAVALYETAPPSNAMVRALIEHGSCLNWAGRVREAVETDRRLVAVCRSLGDAVGLRQALVQLAGHLSRDGWTAEGRALLAEARATPTPRPDPLGDIYIGLVETDTVLRFGGGPEALLAAGRNALAAAETWHLETGRALGVRSNIATGLLRAGQVREAGELVDGITDEYPYADAWGAHAVRAALDTVRGRLDEAMERLQELQAAAAGVLDDREATAIMTPCELWSNRPDLAFQRLRRSLEDEVGSFDQISTGECQVLAVRAAADLADTGAAARPELRRQVDRLLAGTDPTDTPGEAQRAHRAARAAELARLAARPRPDLWAAAVKEWDTIGRPFEAAYARWRGAQAALATGQGTLAQRWLQRAGKDARDHLPLAEVVSAAQRSMEAVAAGPRPGSP
jgi:tetratricopeptide (TPR) repeat protein